MDPINEEPLEPFNDSVDLHEIGIQEVTVTSYMGQPMMEVIGASVGDILEDIGIDRVKEYFGIREEEDF